MPIVVPLSCLNVFMMKLKIFFKTISTSSTRVSIEVSFSVLKPRYYLQDDKPFWG